MRVWRERRSAEVVGGVPCIPPLKEVIYGAAVKYATKRNLGRPTKLFVSGSDGVRQRLRSTSGIWEWVSVVIRWILKNETKMQ